MVCRAVDRAVSVGSEERYFRKESLGDAPCDIEDSRRSVDVIRIEFKRCNLRATFGSQIHSHMRKIKLAVRLSPPTGIKRILCTERNEFQAFVSLDSMSNILSIVFYLLFQFQF